MNRAFITSGVGAAFGQALGIDGESTPNQKFGAFVATSIFSGFTAKAYGGDFWEGARQGATSSALNHLSHSFSNDIITQIENRQNQQNGEGPTIDKGGFIENYEEFYDYMLEQAKNNPVEVAAFEINDNGDKRYFVQPWEHNEIDVSYNDINNIPNYGADKVVRQYHTHPNSSPPSMDDAKASSYWGVPVHTIGANGNMWQVSYPKGYMVPIRKFIPYGKQIH